MRYWTDGAEIYRSAADFPIPDSEPVRYYLASSGTDATTHRLSNKNDGTGMNRWAAVPLGATITPSFDEVANQLVSYEAEMDEEVEFSGPIAACLSSAATKSTRTWWRGSAAPIKPASIICCRSGRSGLPAGRSTLSGAPLLRSRLTSTCRSRSPPACSLA